MVTDVIQKLMRLLYPVERAGIHACAFKTNFINPRDKTHTSYVPERLSLLLERNSMWTFLERGRRQR